MRAKLAACTALLVMLAFTSAHAKPDWGAVARALGKSGTELPEGVYRVGLPRSDLEITVDGVTIKPALALGSWLAFRENGDEAMVMGDLVLTQDEANPVMKSLAESRIEITALHNHLLRAEPMPLYMHIAGHGDAVRLAEALHKALAMSKTPLEAAPPGAQPQALELDTTALDKLLGAQGKANGGVYQFTIARAEMITDGGMNIPASMGSGIAINFQPMGNGRAAITGDFVLIASEVNPVLLVLRENGIEVTAIHNHMLDDQPRLFFMHFWAADDAIKLARGLKEALGKVNIAKS
ncbi:DUF1259 domain-containing protein [Beijerinckia indica]|uniref:DUF1259 domain-containing protein n=1 Tax=Beijerinckia indica subsp. indica (strain ATCC 9039 / DSM 1715 / NCIMB 8712) TaxID=395963 RepID=B2IFY3_BEII9|nr:DUF1259 domain-containing protein [Beijerinckia indica]ACB95722.1 protein of unknown function LppY and LpqO [Beijerinckia indica subsp. indica ATCC 9039]